MGVSEVQLAGRTWDHPGANFHGLSISYPGNFGNIFVSCPRNSGRPNLMSLSEAAVYVKRLLSYSWIAVVGIAIIWLVVLGGINVIPNLFNGGVKADIAFGVIPKPTIPQNVTSKGLSFVLDTVDGKFPQLPSLLAVYQ